MILVYGPAAFLIFDLIITVWLFVLADMTIEKHVRNALDKDDE